MNIFNENKIFVLGLLFTFTSNTLTMEQPVERPHEESLIQQLSTAVQTKDFNNYFALLDKQPLEQRRELIHLNLLNRAGMKKALHFAAEQGNAGAVKKLLECGATLYDTDSVDMTPLLYAAKNGDVETLTLLLAKGADKTSVSPVGMTALHWAAAGNNVPAINLLIKEYGFSVDSDPSYEAIQIRHHTPLHTAAEHGHIAAIDTLIDLSAQKDVLNNVEANALHLASRAGKTAAVVALIVKHGFDPNALCGWSKTALLYAVQEHGTCETVNALIAHGAIAPYKDKTGWSALHWAITSNKPAIIALLLKEYGLDPQSENKKEETPLRLAICRNSCLAELALRCAGAQCKLKDEVARVRASCLKGLMPESASPIMLDALSKESLAPWDPNVVDSVRDSTTPLIRAAQYGCIDCLMFLLNDPRTNPNMQDWQRNTALHLIIKDWAFDNSPKMYARLLNLRRTNVGLKDEDGNTPRQLLNKIIEGRAPNPNLQKLSRLLDLRKMRVQAYLALKNARCSKLCIEEPCMHIPRLIVDICFKIVGMLTEESLPAKTLRTQ